MAEMTGKDIVALLTEMVKAGKLTVVFANGRPAVYADELPAIFEAANIIARRRLDAQR